MRRWGEHDSQAGDIAFDCVTFVTPAWPDRAVTNSKFQHPQCPPSSELPLNFRPQLVLRIGIYLGRLPLLFLVSLSGMTP